MSPWRSSTSSSRRPTRQHSPGCSLSSRVLLLVAIGQAFMTVAMEIHGSPRPYAAQVRSVFSRSSHGVLVGVIVGLSSMLGSFLLVLSGLYLLVKPSLSRPAVFIDGKPAGDALSTIWALTTDRMFPIVGLLLTFVAAQGTEPHCRHHLNTGDSPQLPPSTPVTHHGSPHPCVYYRRRVPLHRLLSVHIAARLRGQPVSTVN